MNESRRVAGAPHGRHYMNTILDRSVEIAQVFLFACATDGMVRLAVLLAIGGLGGLAHFGAGGGLPPLTVGWASWRRDLLDFARRAVGLTGGAGAPPIALCAPHGT